MIQQQCLQQCGTMLSHHDIKVQILAARCIGYMGRLKSSAKLIVTQGALLQLLTLLTNSKDTRVINEALRSLGSCYLKGELACRTIKIWGTSVVTNMAMNSKNEETTYLAARVLKNYSSVDAIAVYMVKEMNLFSVLNRLLESDKSVQCRREAAEAFWNLCQLGNEID